MPYLLPLISYEYRTPYSVPRTVQGDTTTSHFSFPTYFLSSTTCVCGRHVEEGGKGGGERGEGGGGRGEVGWRRLFEMPLKMLRTSKTLKTVGRAGVGPVDR